jgi:hypothetical protein
MIGAERADIVLLGISVPAMDGLQAIARDPVTIAGDEDRRAARLRTIRARTGKLSHGASTLWGA